MGDLSLVALMTAKAVLARKRGREYGGRVQNDRGSPEDAEVDPIEPDVNTFLVAAATDHEKEQMQS
jgi:hypothetical protein